MNDECDIEALNKYLISLVFTVNFFHAHRLTAHLFPTDTHAHDSLLILELDFFFFVNKFLNTLSLLTGMQFKIRTLINPRHEGV